MADASAAPDDRAIYAREAACAVLDDGRTHAEAIDYFGISSLDLAAALVAEAKERQMARANRQGGRR